MRTLRDMRHDPRGPCSVGAGSKYSCMLMSHVRCALVRSLHFLWIVEGRDGEHEEARRQRTRKVLRGPWRVVGAWEAEGDPGATKQHAQERMPVTHARIAEHPTWASFEASTHACRQRARAAAAAAAAAAIAAIAAGDHLHDGISISLDIVVQPIAQHVEWGDHRAIDGVPLPRALRAARCRLSQIDDVRERRVSLRATRYASDDASEKGRG